MRNKCKIFKRGRKQAGITLVALVVTIVVLLILAGVSLSLVLDNNGIITRAGDAKEEYGKARENEQKDLDTMADDIDRALGEYDPLKKITEKTIEEAKSDDMLNSTEETKVKFTDGIVVIPKGHKISSDTAEDVGHGIVIQDGSGNQWVWVPVENVSKYYESVDAGVAISGSTVTTKKYTKLSIEIGTGNNKTTITRGLPNSSDYREPALLSTRSDSDTRRDSDDNAKKAGFADANDMATKMVSEYDTMIKSIEKYGGFYIGRYELSGTVNNPTEQSGATITNTTWYDLYNACKKLGANTDGTYKEGIATRMIWGCQWDATCDFIATKGEQKDITNSSTWGNYYDSASPANTGNYENRKKKDTGSNEAWKANNIYDIAGNCYEWTQEAYNTYSVNRAIRGGFYSSHGSSYPASCRHDYVTTISDDTYVKRFSSHFNNYYWNLERENQWKEGQNRLTENKTNRRKPLIANEIRYDGKIYSKKSTNSVIQRFFELHCYFLCNGRIKKLIFFIVNIKRAILC